MTQQSMSEWISVKDDRPKVGDEFLIWVDPNLVFKHCEMGWPCESPIGISLSRTLPALCFHWMPLPKPPEKLEKEIKRLVEECEKIPTPNFNYVVNNEEKDE